MLIDKIRTIIGLLGLAGTGAAATGIGLGVDSSGGDPWQIALSVIGVIAAGGVGTFGANKITQLKALFREASEALVATGLAGVSLSKALEDNKLTDDERKELAERAKAVIKENTEVWNAALKLISKK